jgi:hypothetical protein
VVPIIAKPAITFDVAVDIKNAITSLVLAVLDLTLRKKKIEPQTKTIMSGEYAL